MGSAKSEVSSVKMDGKSLLPVHGTFPFHFSIPSTQYTHETNIFINGTTFYLLLSNWPQSCTY